VVGDEGFEPPTSCV